MKRFSVKVNGQVYEVEVTELKSGESAPAAAYTTPAYSHAAPAPAAAAMVMMPVLISFDFIEAENYLRTHLFCGLWMCIVSYLETSRIPTISLKKTKINASMIIPLLIIVALMANFLFTQTWLTLGVLTALYTLSIPLGVLKFLKDKRDFQKAQAVSEQI